MNGMILPPLIIYPYKTCESVQKYGLIPRSLPSDLGKATNQRLVSDRNLMNDYLESYDVCVLEAQNCKIGVKVIKTYLNFLAKYLVLNNQYKSGFYVVFINSQEGFTYFNSQGTQPSQKKVPKCSVTYQDLTVIAIFIPEFETANGVSCYQPQVLNWGLKKYFVNNFASQLKARLNNLEFGKHDNLLLHLDSGDEEDELDLANLLNPLSSGRSIASSQLSSAKTEANLHELLSTTQILINQFKSNFTNSKIIKKPWNLLKTFTNSNNFNVEILKTYYSSVLTGNSNGLNANNTGVVGSILDTSSNLCPKLSLLAENEWTEEDLCKEPAIELSKKMIEGIDLIGYHEIKKKSKICHCGIVTEIKSGRKPLFCGYCGCHCDQNFS